MKYLFICDFDGTLANNSGAIAASTALDIKKILIKNKLCILSYTKFNELTNIINMHNLECDYFSISSTCGKINNNLYYSALNYKVINKLFYDFSYDIYTAYTSFFNEAYIYNYQERLDLIYPKINRKIINKLDKDIMNLTIVINKTSYDNFYHRLEADKLNYTVLAQDKNRDIILINPLGFTKADIINHLRTIYPEYQTVGIGDSFEDFEFIKHCDIKIAMLNADEKLKKLCDITTELDCNNSGCTHELLKLNNS